MENRWTNKQTSNEKEKKNRNGQRDKYVNR